MTTKTFRKKLAKLIDMEFLADPVVIDAPDGFDDVMVVTGEDEKTCFVLAIQKVDLTKDI